MASQEVGVFTLAKGGLGVNGEDDTDAPATPEIAIKEMEALEAIKEDICKWLAETMQVDITPPTFMSKLDSGVVLCKLAGAVQQATTKMQSNGRKNIPETPSQPVHFNDKAESESFLARDNTSNFINWCRKLGVEEAVIFESEGLVLHRDEKRVILCLLDVARFADLVGISPPQLVRMEREIEELDSGGASTTHKSRDHPSGRAASSNGTHSKQSELSRKVLQVLTNCACSIRGLEVQDCGSGKFIVKGGRIRAPKTLYARLLSDRIMVRVGGGWDTLDHFLIVHDPCRVKQFIQLKQGPNDEIVKAHLQAH